MSVDLSLLWSSLMLKTIPLEMAEVKSCCTRKNNPACAIYFGERSVLVTQQKQVELAAGDKLEITTN
jgi:hypothetical protein